MKSITTALLIFIAHITFSQQKIFISNIGNDKNRGTKTQPLYSLQSAFDLAKKNKKQAVDIIVEKGNYYYDNPILLDSSYSRTKNNKITVVGDVNNNSVIYGGEKITPILDYETGYWKFNVKNNQDNSNRRPSVLTVDGNLRKVSEFPKSGLLTPLDVFYDEGIITVKIPKELNELLNLYSSENIKRVFVTFYVKWSSIIRYINSHNYKNSTISFKGENLPQIYLIEKNKTQFKVSNIKRPLIAGEWYSLDSQTILYNPLKADNIKTSNIVLAMLDKILRISGSAKNRTSYINFKNIAFDTFGAGVDPSGYFPYQAAAKIESAIQLSNVSYINFENISVRNISLYAISIEDKSKNVSVSKSQFSNLGAGAIKIGNIKSNTKDEATNNIFITNNIIQKGGLLFPDAVGILVLDSYSNLISHNVVSNFMYTGISVGWNWGYGESLAYKNIISFNHIYNIGNGILDDMGGIYTLGVSSGTVIDNNVIHDVNSKNYGGWGIYTDEGSSGILIKNNLVYNCNSSGYHHHYGTEITIKNNIFAFNNAFELEATKIEDHLSLSLSDNVFVHKDGFFYNNNWALLKKNMTKNIYYSINGSDYKSIMKNESNSYIVNPLLQKKNFYYQIGNKDIFKLTNFKNIDFSKVGLNP